MATTRLSSKGQVVLPSATRTSRKWNAGTEFQVVETPEGVLLRPIAFAPSRLEDVFGMAGYSGPRRSLSEMDAAVRKEASRRR
ncbi:MAG: AbrB/MazE/SpoVT family DNA-binding domain-containing protein [Alphaproteobacteria bacterium]|nr:AbrB/MazE/SpoVT family DNA-binding domain-containing protein [Alphaproteobacteria bacterium]